MPDVLKFARPIEPLPSSVIEANCRRFIESVLKEIPMRYTTIWRNKLLTTEAKTIDDMIAGLQGAADQLRAMKDAGVTLDGESGVEDDYAVLVTEDRKVAKKFGMEKEEAESVEGN